MTPNPTPQLYLNIPELPPGWPAGTGCRLAYSTHKGNRVVISGREYEVPCEPAPMLYNDGLAAGQRYFAYLRAVNAIQVQPVARTTTPIADWDDTRQTGQSVNTADHDETLIGMFMLDEECRFVSSPRRQLVSSDPVRHPLHAEHTLTADVVVSTPWVWTVLGDLWIDLLTWGYAVPVFGFASFRAETEIGADVEIAARHHDGKMVRSPRKSAHYQSCDSITLARPTSTTFSPHANAPLDGYLRLEMIAKVSAPTRFFAGECFLSAILQG